MSLRIYGIALICAVILGVFAIYIGSSKPQEVIGGFDTIPATNTPPGGIPQPPPLPSDYISAKGGAEGSESFFLVSYTDRGFEPIGLEVALGDTVRFTNNSSRRLWVVADVVPGSTLYPPSLNSCGSSAFDSCGLLELGRHWEFVFKRSGSWAFTNSLFRDDVGIIHVQ